jgi:hypothetical protein
MSPTRSGVLGSQPRTFLIQALPQDTGIEADRLLQQGSNPDWPLLRPASSARGRDNPGEIRQRVRLGIRFRFPSVGLSTMDLGVPTPCDRRGELMS